MARAWLYDRRNSKDYRDAVQRAKQAGKQPPARWQIRYYDRAGKLRSEVAATKTRAEDRRTELESALSAGTYVDPALSRVDFAGIADKWLDARQDLRPSTWWKYRGLLDNHVNVRWGDLPLSAIEREEIATWVAMLLKPKWTAPTFVEAQPSTGLPSGRLRRSLPVGLLELQRGNVPAP